MQNPLFDALRRKSTPLSLLSTLIACSPDLDKADRTGTTALLLSIRLDRPDAVSLLLEHGAAIPQEALIEAVGNADITRILLEKGADVDARDSGGNTALMKAAQGKSKETVSMLLEKGASPDACNSRGENALYLSAAKGSLDVFNTLLEASGCPLPGLLLHQAAKNPDALVLRKALALGCDVSARDKDGRTPLIVAAGRDTDGEAVRMLLEAGADKDAKDNRGRSALMTATVLSAITNLKVLLEAGADINAKDNEEKTCLMLYASMPGLWQANILRMLLQSGAAVSLTDRNGWTALHHAALSSDNPEILLLLLEKGASVDVLTPEGLTAYDIAKENGKDEEILALLSQGRSR